MLLLYFMDGLKISMAKEHMPFLAGLRPVPLRSDFGYSCACHATMYTGRSVQEHNTWFVWKKGPNSPYQFVDRIPLLKYLNCIPVKFAVSKIARKLHKNRSFSGIPMLVNLPLKYWSLFEPCETSFWTDDEYKPGMPTLFKILREQEIAHDIVGLSRGGDVFAEEAKVDYEKDQFVYYFLGEVDSYLHKYGERAPESVEYLKKVDGFLRETYEKAAALHDDVTVICYSDHGHIDVEEKIDIDDYFKPRGRRVNRYIHLVESTFARFWPRSESERAEIIEVLGDMAQEGLGFVVDGAMRNRYHLEFDSDEHGDIVFHLRAPNIFTRTIWGFGKTIRSMHGYQPELPAHLGVFAANRPLADTDFVYLTDILPTVLGSIGVDASPYHLSGRDLLGQQTEGGA